MDKKSQNGYSGRASSPDGGDAAGTLAWRLELGTVAIAYKEIVNNVGPKNIKIQNSFMDKKSQNGYSGRASSPDGGDAAGALAWRFEFGTPARHCCCRAGQPSAAVAAAAGCVLAPSSQLSHVGRRHLQRSRAGTFQRFIFHKTILVTFRDPLRHRYCIFLITGCLIANIYISICSQLSHVGCRHLQRSRVGTV